MSTVANRFNDKVRLPQDKKSYTFFFALLLTYLAIEFIRPQDIYSAIGVLRPAMVSGVLLILFSLSQFKSSIYGDKAIKLMIFFVLLSILSVAYATNNFHAFNKAQTMTLVIFAGVIPSVLLINSMDRFQFLLKFWIAVHAYLAVYSLLHAGRGPGSFLADENDIALALNSVLPLAYFMAQCPSVTRKERLLLLASVVLIVAAIVATASRGGFVGLAVSTAAMVYFSKHRLRNAVVLVLASGVFFLAIPDSYRSEIESISDTDDGTRNERIISWKIGWEMFLDNPILGVGAGNYPWRVSDYQDYDPDRRMLGGRAAHSLYFTLLPEYGLLGSVTYLLLLLNVVGKLRKAIRDSVRMQFGETSRLFESVARGLLVGLVGFLVSAVFITVLYYPTFWMIAAFATVLALLTKEHVVPGKSSD